MVNIVKQCLSDVTFQVKAGNNHILRRLFKNTAHYKRQKTAQMCKNSISKSEKDKRVENCKQRNTRISKSSATQKILSKLCGHFLRTGQRQQQPTLDFWILLAISYIQYQVFSNTSPLHLQHKRRRGNLFIKKNTSLNSLKLLMSSPTSAGLCRQGSAGVSEARGHSRFILKEGQQSKKNTIFCFS